MKVDLNTVVPIFVVAAGVIFGYGVLSDKVDRIPFLLTLSDDNMNKIIVLETKMDMLVTPQMEIVPDPRTVGKFEAVKTIFDNRLSIIEREIFPLNVQQKGN